MANLKRGNILAFNFIWTTISEGDYFKQSCFDTKHFFTAWIIDFDGHGYNLARNITPNRNGENGF